MRRDSRRKAPHRDLLRQEIERAGCVAYVYCFMPDHLHAILLGIRDDATPKARSTVSNNNNPLRAGLVEDPLEYPFSGCIGTDYRELLETIL